MSKLFKYILVAMLFGTAFAACSGPKTIPDNTLSDIYRDLFLVNSYTNRHNVTPDRILDSVNIYEPVFERYGYTSKDFVYTLNEFSKRKSTRMRDILDQAIVKLDQWYASLIKERQYLSFLDSAAMVLTQREVYRDSLIKARRMADTAKLTIRIPAEPGKYDITFHYTLDSLDKNPLLKNTFSIYTKDGRRLSYRTLNMNARSRRVLQNLTLESGDYADSLVIRFGNYIKSTTGKVNNPHLTIDSLVIVHMPPLEEAYETLYRSISIKRTILDSIRYGLYPQEDSLSLHILPPLVGERRDSLVVEGREVAGV